MTEKLQSPHVLGDSPPLTTLAVGDRVARPLMITDMERRSSSRGPFTVLTLGDRTGSIPSAPFWAESRLAEGVHRGDVVQIGGRITQYAGRRQLSVNSLDTLVNADPDPRRWLPSIRDAAPFWRRLEGWRRRLDHVHSRRIADLFYDDPAFRARYELCPGSTSGHHAELGGLLRHTCEVIAIARTIGRQCGAEQDLLVLGGLLHDIGKLEAYEWRAGFRMTDAGTLVGHVVLGALMLGRRLGSDAPDLLADDRTATVMHLLLSHHGTRENGAPVVPMTLEAQILHHADDASARACSMATAIADPDNFDDQATVSRPVWQLDRRRVFRRKRRPPRPGEPSMTGQGDKNGTAV